MPSIRSGSLAQEALQEIQYQHLQQGGQELQHYQVIATGAQAQLHPESERVIVEEAYPSVDILTTPVAEQTEQQQNLLLHQQQPAEASRMAAACATTPIGISSTVAVAGSRSTVTDSTVVTSAGNTQITEAVSAPPSSCGVPVMCSPATSIMAGPAAVDTGSAAAIATTASGNTGLSPTTTAGPESSAVSVQGGGGASAVHHNLGAASTVSCNGMSNAVTTAVASSPATSVLGNSGSSHNNNNVGEKVGDKNPSQVKLDFSMF